MPHASQPKTQSIKQKQHCNKFGKDFKNYPHQKKYLKKEKLRHRNYYYNKEKLDKYDHLKFKTAYIKGYYKSSKEISHRPGEDIYIKCIKEFSA